MTGVRAGSGGTGLSGGALSQGSGVTPSGGVVEAPEFVNATAQAITPGATSFQHTLATGASPGDIQLVHWVAGIYSATNDTGLASPPAGWAVAAQQYRSAIWYRIYQEGDSPTVTANFVSAVGTDPYVASAVYTKVDETYPLIPSKSIATTYQGNSFNVQGNYAPKWNPYVNILSSDLSEWTSWYEGTIQAGFTAVLSDAAKTDLGDGYQPTSTFTVTGDLATLANTNRRVKAWYTQDYITAGNFEQGSRINIGWSSSVDRPALAEVTLRGKRTADWLAKPQVIAYRGGYRSGAWTNKAMSAEFDFFPPDLSRAIFLYSAVDATGNEIDTSVSPNTWLNRIAGNMYWGAAAGLSSRQISATLTGDVYYHSMIIDNVNTTNPFYSWWRTAQAGNNRMSSAPSAGIGVSAPIKAANTSQYELQLCGDRHAAGHKYTFVASADIEEVVSQGSHYQTGGAGDRELCYGLGKIAATGTIKGMTKTCTTTPSVVRCEANLVLNPTGVNPTAWAPSTTPTVRSFGTPTVWTYNVTATRSVALPPGLTPGDLLVLVLNRATETPLLTDIGLKCIGASQFTADQIFWTKIADGTETAVNISTTGSSSAFMFALQNASALHFDFNALGSITTTAGVGTGLAATTPENNMLVLRHGQFFSNSATGLTHNQGSVGESYKQDNFTDSWMSYYYEGKATAGAITPGSWTTAPAVTPMYSLITFFRGA